MTPSTQIKDLLTLMTRLREDCSWDQKQTHHTLAPYLLEEAYEAHEAVLSGVPEAMLDELGDVLFQVVFHAELLKENSQGDFGSVVHALMEKLIRRHPHVFNQNQLSPEEVELQWQQIKAEEKAKKRSMQLAAQSLTGQAAKPQLQPQTQPNMQHENAPNEPLIERTSGSALMQAQRLQRQAAKLGLDWQNVSGALDKLKEEVEELSLELEKLQQAAQGCSSSELAESFNSAVKEELADVLFSVVNVSRKLNLNAEEVLLEANKKFERRFNSLGAKLDHGSVKDASLSELEHAWQLVKSEEAK